MDMKNGNFSEQLQLKVEPDTEVLDLNPNKQETKLLALPVENSNELEKSQILKKENLISISNKVYGGAHFNRDADVSPKDHVNEETPDIQKKVSSVSESIESRLDEVDQVKQRELIPLVVKEEVKGSKSMEILPNVEPKLDSVEQIRISDGGTDDDAQSSLMKLQVESETRVSQFNQVCIIPSKDGSEKKQRFVSASPFDQETVTRSAQDDKTLYKLQPRRNHLDNGGHPLSSIPEENISSVLATDDGYSWRKYGQKFVKRIIRSYYKCTSSNCRAKKHVERSHDGPLTDIKYIGTHEHHRPYNPQLSSFVSPAQVTVTDLSIASRSKDEDAAALPADICHVFEPPVTPRQGGSATPDTDHEESGDSQVLNLQSSDGDGGSPSLKKQKRVSLSADGNTVRTTYCESGRIVQTVSVVDLIDDGYRWRKYGQKLVKGNPNPRSYYRCTKSGCQAKKHVERASHDSKLVITTYEAKHDHDDDDDDHHHDMLPTSKNNASDTGVSFTSINTRESMSEHGEHKSMEIHKAVVDVGVQTD